jgi:hypothetical protein
MKINKTLTSICSALIAIIALFISFLKGKKKGEQEIKNAYQAEQNKILNRQIENVQKDKQIEQDINNLNDSDVINELCKIGEKYNNS